MNFQAVWNTTGNCKNVIFERLFFFSFNYLKILNKNLDLI